MFVASAHMINLDHDSFSANEALGGAGGTGGSGAAVHRLEWYQRCEWQ